MSTAFYDHARLKQACEPTNAFLDDLIYHSAPDAATRTMMTTALVLTLWQRCGRRMSYHIPSMITLNAAGANADPVDDFVKKLIWNEKKAQPGPHGTRSSGTPIQPADAHTLVKVALIQRKTLNRTIAHDRFAQDGSKYLDKNFNEARNSAFGYGSVRAYTRAWDDQLGLLADENDEIILRLNSPEDRDAFRRDVIKNPEKLLLPSGVSLLGQMNVSIAASISGSLNESLWDDKLISAVIKMGLPIIFLPHTAADPLKIRNLPALECFEFILSRGRDIGVDTSLSVTPNDWFKAHVNEIRRRLRLLPEPGTYEFAILQVLHQLRDVCHEIARYACKDGNATGDQVMALWWDLKAHTLRGITLGIAAFAWHGLGFNPGCSRQKALKIIKQLRTKGPMSPSEIIRSAHLNKQERDLLLKRLSAEDLIRVEGKTVMATTFVEFVAALQNRPGLSDPVKFSDLIAEAKRRKKAR